VLCNIVVFSILLSSLAETHKNSEAVVFCIMWVVTKLSAESAVSAFRVEVKMEAVYSSETPVTTL
jgi:hypothetical protein